MQINKELKFTNSDNCAWNEPMVHQVVTSKQSSMRSDTARQKNRSAVSGGGKKPWKQKGTGRARAGTTRGPIWRGGGVTFANTGRNYFKKINKKVYNKAFQMVLIRMQDAELVIFVNNFSIDSPSTKDAIKFLSPIKTNEEKNKRVIIVVKSCSDSMYLSFRNIPNVEIVEVSSLGILHLVNCDTMIVSVESHAILSKKYHL